VVPTNAASFSSTGQKSKVKIPKSLLPLPFLPRRFPLALPQSVHLAEKRKMSEVDGALKRIQPFTALYHAETPFLNYDLDIENAFRSLRLFRNVALEQLI